MTKGPSSGSSAASGGERDREEDAQLAQDESQEGEDEFCQRDLMISTLSAVQTGLTIKLFKFLCLTMINPEGPQVH